MKTIGVVDDHIQSAINIASFLENNGFTTFQAYNTEKAIEEINSKKPDLIIMDLGHDGVDGYEIIDSCKSFKFIIMSLEDIEKIEFSKHKNIRGFIKKPFELSDLLSLIKKKL